MKPEYIYKATVTEVVDGDTVDLLIDCGFNIIRKERIRFFGILIPAEALGAWETRGEERQRGELAKEFVQRVIPPGTEVIVRTIKEQGEFGNYLGEIFCVGRSLNDMLLEEGHAEVYK